MRSLRVGLLLAVRSVMRSNYGIAMTTTLMILLIYISLLFLPSLIQGAIDRVDNQLLDTLTSNIVITPAGSQRSIADLSSYLAGIRKTTGVQQATPVYHIGTEVAYGANSGSFSVAAIDPATYRQVFTTPSNLFEGRALKPGDTDQALIGIGIAGAGQTQIRGYRASLQNVHAGDRVTITLTDGRSLPVTVAGIYDNQFPASDNDAYITLHEAARLNPASADHATTIYVRTRSDASPNAVITRLQHLRNGVKFQTSADLGAAVQDQTASYRLISNILKIISLLMAAITIFTITYIDLVNKRRQIGIRREIGINSAPIVLSCLAKAWAYAATGIAAGLLLFEFVITPIVHSHPFHFPNGPVSLATTEREIVLDVMLLAIAAAIAAILPAIRAVRIPILDAIWST